MDRSAALACEDHGEALRRSEAAVEALVSTPEDARPSWLASTITICARLAIERTKGRASRMFPYIASLPRDFRHHPLLWRGGGDRALEGTYLLDAIRDQRKSLRSFVAVARACRDAALPECSRGDLTWAYLCWMTRCIGIVGGAPDGQTAWAFVPMVDMTNCAWSPLASGPREGASVVLLNVGVG